MQYMTDSPSHPDSLFVHQTLCLCMCHIGTNKKKETLIAYIIGQIHLDCKIILDRNQKRVSNWIDQLDRNQSRSLRWPCPQIQKKCINVRVRIMSESYVLGILWLSSQIKEFQGNDQWNEGSNTSLQAFLWIRYMYRTKVGQLFLLRFVQSHVYNAYATNVYSCIHSIAIHSTTQLVEYCMVPYNIHTIIQQYRLNITV